MVWLKSSTEIGEVRLASYGEPYCWIVFLTATCARFSSAGNSASGKGTNWARAWASAVLRIWERRFTNSDLNSDLSSRTSCFTSVPNRLSSWKRGTRTSAAQTENTNTSDGAARPSTKSEYLWKRKKVRRAMSDAHQTTLNQFGSLIEEMVLRQ